MANPWFRLYSEFANDPKVQMMSEAMQRRLVMLFCMHNDGIKLNDDAVGFTLRISPAEVQETRQLFVSKGFIETRGNAWHVSNWNKRQFISDSSTDRVRRFREKKKQNETFHETDETLPVTPPEQIQNRTEQNRTDLSVATLPLALTSPSESSPVVGTLPLVDGSNFEVTAAYEAELIAAYPAVNVRQQFREMKQWVNANPTNRKTRRGIKAFIVKWLGKEQDKAPSGGLNGAYRQRPTAAQAIRQRNIEALQASDPYFQRRAADSAIENLDDSVFSESGSGSGYAKVLDL